MSGTMPQLFHNIFLILDEVVYLRYPVVLATPHNTHRIARAAESTFRTSNQQFGFLILKLTDDEWSTLQQVAKILKPFWDHTNSVSKACPTIVESLPIYWSLDDLLNDVRNAEGDFEDVNIEIRDAVERGIRKMNKFARKMDDNLLYYVASVLDLRIKSSLIVSQMSEQDSGLIVSQVWEFLKKEYPPELFVSCEVDHTRPAGMSETMWRTLRKVQPSKEASLSDIDK